MYNFKENNQQKLIIGVSIANIYKNLFATFCCYVCTDLVSKTRSEDRCIQCVKWPKNGLVKDQMAMKYQVIEQNLCVDYIPVPKNIK